MISSLYSDCLERGYEAIEDFCQFPDGSKCKLEDFNTNTCGQEFKTADYCVKQDGYVWNQNRCCPGLEPYLPEGYTGQTTCQPITPAPSPSPAPSSSTLLFIIPVSLAVIILALFLILRRR